MIEHLILSTLVLAAAWLAARSLPLTARTRHALLLAGLAKFALPASLFQTMGIQPIAAMPDQFRLFVGATAAAPRTQQVNWLTITWAAVALLIAIRWLILRSRTLSSALRNSSAPSPRELDALAFARRALKVRAAVDLVHSPICEAPAVLRIVRPVIVLPPHACDDLDDDELRTLLLHECAHITRRDNLVSLLETSASALLWFHPLVWLVLRDLATTREEACDEAVADAIGRPDTYLSALTKICRNVVAARAAGASCMASARIKERMDHLMSYTRLQSRAFSHRAVLAAAVAIILTITTAAAALETRREPKPQLYKLNFTVTPDASGIHFDIDVVDRATNQTVASPKITTQPNQWTPWERDHGAHKIRLNVRARADGAAELFIRVLENDETLQENLYTYTPKPAPDRPKNGTYDGAPISINLRNADLKDVLKTFGQITGYKVVLNSEIKGSVTIDVVDVPWDEVFDKLAKEHGLTVKIENGTMTITQ